MRTEPPALRNFALIAALLLVAQIFSLSSLPFDLQEPWDKVWHFIAYASLAMLLWIATDGRRPMLLIAGVIVLGALDEFRQAAIPSRGADMLDFGADALGAMLTGTLMLWKTGAKKPCVESSAR
jgi:VanZ family protein